MAAANPANGLILVEVERHRIFVGLIRVGFTV